MLLTNTGGSPISVRVPTLLRIYLGAQNYVDLKLSQENFKGDQVPPNGSKSFTFASDEVQSLPKENKDLINLYWGQSVYAILFVQDTLNEVHFSNKIPFTKGLYQKLIYDRLAAEASQAFHSSH